MYLCMFNKESLIPFVDVQDAYYLCIVVVNFKRMPVEENNELCNSNTLHD